LSGASGGGAFTTAAGAFVVASGEGPCCALEVAASPIISKAPMNVFRTPRLPLPFAVAFFCMAQPKA
jgi:hypothetical protein